MRLLGGVADAILRLHGWAALAVVFAVPALEASAFVGFVFPGEIAVLLGGVLAYQGRVSLGGALAAAILGAVIGDSVGYLVGRRWGRAILRRTIGRLPIVRHHVEKSVDRARDFLRRRGPHAVVLGRFTAGLRVMVPGLAGMSRMPYRRFFLSNVVGGAIWATTFVLLGYFGGAAWQRIADVASKAGLILLALIVIGLIAVRLARDTEALRRFGDRIAAKPPFAWIRRRFPSQVAWIRGRLDAGRPGGFPLTLAVAAGALCAWAFEDLTADVAAHDGLAAFDPRIESLVVAHRTGWLSGIMQPVTWLGSNVVLIPVVLIVGGYFLLRRGDRMPLVALGASAIGAIGLYDAVKPLVARPRPPARFEMGHALTGFAFPSGHATQSVAVWGMLAFLAAAMSRRARPVPFVAAIVVVALVGASRIYLGAHWLTDVLGGYALGGLWLSVLVALMLVRGESDVG